MENKREFSKSDLTNGMIVETRKGTLLLVLNGNLVNNDSWVSLSHYNEDLTRYDWMKDDYRDIVKVYKTKGEQTLNNMFKNKTLIWERVEYKEMTIDEIEKELGYKIKIIKGDYYVLYRKRK